MVSTYHFTTKDNISALPERIRVDPGMIIPLPVTGLCMGDPRGGSASGQGSLEAEILAHMRMIELQYRSRIVNKEEIAQKILSRTDDPVSLLSIALSLNNWMAVSGRTGDIKIPVEVIDTMIDHALMRRAG
jgi:hypothetical protein